MGNRYLKKELIGNRAKISYNNRSLEGIIINETRNMLELKTRKGVKKIVKKNSVIYIDGKMIQGKDIAKRPEDRIKM